MKKTIHTCTTVRTYSYISIYIYIYVCENSYDASPRPSELRTRPNICGKPSEMSRQPSLQLACLHTI